MKVSKLQDVDASVLSTDWIPNAKGSQEVMALGCADGSFKLMNKTGRVEKTVAEAHASAIISVKWSYEGAALATAGEDGQVKIWSRSAQLRSLLVNGSKPIYQVCWSPEND